MKKITSIVLTAVILIMSVFSVSAFAQEQTKAEKWIQNNQGQNLEYEFLLYSEIGNSQSTNHAYVKGDKISIIADIPLTETETFKLKVVVSDGYLYMLLPSFPFFHLKYRADDVIGSSLDDITSIEDMTLVNSYEITEGQITYYIEEYADDKGTTGKFYFIGDELFKTETSGVDENGLSVYTSLEIISREVDDSVFEIPWYSVNISPFFDFMIDADYFAFL